MIATKKTKNGKIKVYSTEGKGILNKKLSPIVQSEFVIHVDNYIGEDFQEQ